MAWHMLSEVPEEDVRQLLSVARRRRFARGEVVFHRGDPADSLHLVVSGRFVVRTVTPLGEAAAVGLVGSGGSFGELALVGEGAPRSATVTALEAAETFAVYVHDFRALRSRHPHLNDVLVTLLAAEVRRLTSLVEEVLFLPAEKRVRKRLADLARVYGGDPPVELPLTQAELGEFAGAARATVNRVLREEERNGTLELRRGTTVVLDLDGLERRGR